MTSRIVVNNIEPDTGISSVTVNGGLTVTGLLKYEDVKNIDSIGIITARDGLRVTGIATISGDVLIGTTNTTTIGTVNKNLVVGSTTNNDEVGLTLNVMEGVHNRRVKLFLDDDDGVFGVDSTASTGVPPFVVRMASSEKLRITSDGKATFTTPGGDDAFLVKGDNYTGVRIQAARNSASDHAMFQMLGSRGTNASPTILQSGDTLGTISGRGYDGNSYAQSSNILFKVSTTPGDGDMPGKLEFQTSPDGSEGPSTRMIIDHNGHVTKPTNLCLSYTASGSTDYSSGTIIYNTLVFDVNSSGAYNTSTGVFTAPVAGMYLIYHEYYAQTNNKAMTEIQKSTNGGGSFSPIKYTPRVQGSGSDYSAVACTFFAQLNANDQIKIIRREGIIHINNTYTHFQVQLIQ